ncbi:MAG: hypothetical protein RMJ59_07955 [Candidatus Nitrosocaldus sp.]|nr:hypothetical protein [Candidatus Nitrosocaldus sp.]
MGMGLKVSVSGVRGVFPDELTLEDVMHFTRAFSSMIGEGCALAMDTRVSGRIIAGMVSAVLREQGVDVYNLGVAPTPVLMRESREDKVGAGIMVSASHNPLDWNGLKFALHGRGMPADRLPSDHCSRRSRGRNVIGEEHEHASAYVDDLLAFLPLDIHGADRIAVDTAQGSSRRYILEILTRLGFSAVMLDGDSPDPTGSDLAHLRSALADGCRLGIALDMDGDRAVMLTGARSIYKPDDTLLICIAGAVKMGCRSVAVSIDTSNAVRDLARAMNCTMHYSKVGEANVVDTMLSNGCHAGGEGSSAGFIMAGFNLCRDGLLASAIALSMLDELDWVMEYSGRYHVRRGKVYSDRGMHDRLVDELIGTHEYSEVISIDGIKLIVDEGTWVLVRASNTEPVVRLSVESYTRERCDALYRRYEAMIRGG